MSKQNIKENILDTHKVEVAIDKLIEAVGKRRDAEYTQLFAYIPQDLAQDFRNICTSRRLEHSAVIEGLLKTWVAENKK